MLIIAGLVYVFYPKVLISWAPIMSLIVSPAEGIVQLIVLGGLIAFVMPVRTKVAGVNLMQVRKLAIYTAVGYLILSLLPYAFIVPYPQTYIGLIIAFNVLNGGIAGGLATYL